jgi:hypothetical protein
VSQAAYSRLLLGTSLSDWSSVSATRLRFLSEDLKLYRRKVIPQEITGDLGVYADLIRDDVRFVWGPIEFATSPAEMGTLLPYMVGDLDGGSGSGYFLPNTCLNTGHILIKRDYGVFRYKYVQAARWRLSARALRWTGEDVEGPGPNQVILTIWFLGRDRDINIVTWPDPQPEITIDNSLAAYYLSNSEFTFRSSTRTPESFVLAVDHGLKPKFYNSATPTLTCSYGRTTEMQIKLPWNDTNDDLIDQADDQPVTLKFTGLDSRYTQFEFGGAVAEDRDPTAPGKYEDVDWRIRNIMGHVDLSANEFDIKVINDAT